MLRAVGQRLQQRPGVAQVEEHALAARLDALGQRGVALRKCRRARAVDLDHVALQVLGDEAARRALGDLPAVVEHDQALAEALGLVHEVRRQQDRLALAQQALQAFPHQVARLRIESRRRLVEEQQVGVVDQRARQAEPPLHAARQLARPGTGLRLQRGELEQARDALLHHRARQAEVAPVDEQVLGAGEVGVEAVELGDDADARLGLAHALRDRQAERLDRAGVGRDQTERHAQRRRLAGAVGADHAEALAGLDVQRQVVDGDAGAERLAKAVDAEDRHARRRRGCSRTGAAGTRAGAASRKAGMRRPSVIEHFARSMRERGGRPQTASLPSGAASAASVSGRSTSSTNAIGALSPCRKPIFRMRV